MSNLKDLSASDSDSDSNDDFENTNSYLKNKKKIYQVQFIKDDMYQLKWVGMFDNIPSVPLHNFDKDDYSCYISSNFTDFEEEHKNGVCLFDLITLDIIKKNGEHYKLILSVELTDVKLEGENKGNLMIWLEKDGKRVPLKSNLTHPGNEKVQYYLIAEIKNEKINDLLKKI